MPTVNAAVPKVSMHRRVPSMCGFAWSRRDYKRSNLTSFRGRRRSRLHPFSVVITCPYDVPLSFGHLVAPRPGLGVAGDATFLGYS